MQDFFERVENREHAWPAGRRDLHWHLLPDPEIAREYLVEPYAELTRLPGLVPVAAEWLHVTALHSGSQQDATEQEIQEITSRVGEAVAGTGPVRLTFARPAIGNVAVECAARPGAPARRLWQAIWEATSSVVGKRWPRVPATYDPHVSLAYASHGAADLDRSRLKQLLSDLDGAEVTVEFRTLTLVSQWHDRSRIVWERLAEVPLTGEA
jgi:2'-5' RNA ligase